MAVKLILREAVDHLGGAGEIVSVAPGYARNFLVPKGLALEATPGNLKRLEHQRKIWAAREAQARGDAQALADRIGELELKIRKKAGESGTLYGSVTKTEIAELLAAQGIDLDRRRLGSDEPIKTLGSHEIPIRLHREVQATLQLLVEAEAESE